MKHFYLTLILACSVTVTLPAYAAMGGMQGMDNMGSAKNVGGVSGQGAMTQAFMAHGKINSINPDAGTVNITHGPIKALAWPGMTMSFPVQDKAMLNGLKAGEIVNFDLAKDSAGRYVVTRIAPAGQ
ncbi:copper-binding protein [Acidithiobacillus sulfuriphilus]|uniref:copper-binding protein n=1 Tax=Acidithiobacillus sulfuriphilus TaxID=1867749 RepID=UPI003F5EFD8B